MDVKQAWVAWLALLGACVIAAVVVLARRRRRDPQVALANTDTLRGLPEFARAMRAHRAAVVALLVSAAALVALAAAAAARPQQTTVEAPQQRNRDIMLCLDVSGSMTRADAAIARTFRQLVKGFEGERIGLTIFDGTAVTVFPLTDDYEFVTEQLSQAQAVFDGDANPLTFYAGTYNNPAGSSLIGDGLASCVQAFDQLDTTRARSIILATDNQLAGEPIFTLDEAGELAKTKKVRVYGINPSDVGNSDSRRMREITTGTGGAYYPLQDSNAVNGIVGQVQAQEATLINSAPRRFRSDQPRALISLAGVALLGLLVAGRRWRA